MNKFLFFILISYLSTSFAQVRLPDIFSDNMVLQRNSRVDIWGWSNPNEQISLVASWNPQDTLKTVGNRQAQWNIVLKTPEGAGPFTIRIKGYNEVVINNVLLGETWLASGQSNMEWTPAQGLDGGDDLIKNTHNKNIRFFKVSKQTADAPQLDLEGEWVEANPDNANYFSAIAYFFGIKLNEKLKIPIGLISSSWGGSPAETWISEEAFAKNDSLVQGAALLKKEPWCPSEPSRAFNAMINPLIPYKIAGVIWYQGETNTSNYAYYENTFGSWINNWRALWNDDFPFYYAQIAPYDYGEGYSGVSIRDIQRKLLRTPNTGMVVTSDIGNNKDIHPRNKLDVGLRFANLALEKKYGLKSVEESESPLVINAKRLNSRTIAVYFENAKQLTWSNSTSNKKAFFEIVLADTEVALISKISVKDNYVLLKTNSTDIKNAHYIRYGWSNQFTPGLINEAGLPASSFTIPIEN